MIKGERLKQLRKEKHLTQTDLGNMIGVKKSVVSLYENEKRNPSIESIIDFVQIFNVPADYLLGTECLIKTYGNDKEEKVMAFTKEEVEFIQELKKNKTIYDILLADPKRGMELIKTKIG